MSKKAVKQLVFTPHGTAELRQGDKTRWSSDDDDDFAEEVETSEFLEDYADSEAIIDYLVDIELLSEDEELDVITEVDDGT